MDKITHEVRLANWKTIVEQCNNRPQGQSVKQWLADNGINEKTYYYWLRRVRREAYARVSSNLPAVVEDNNRISFAEFSMSESEKTLQNNFSETIQPVAVIKTSSFTIALSDGISDSLLSRIIREVSHA